MRLFNYDSPFMRAITTLCNLTILNLLWLLCCLPIVTIGASTVAMNYSAYQLLNGDKHVFQNFKRGWSLHWKKASIIWIFQGGLTAAFIFYYLVVYQNELPGGDILTIIAIIAFIILIFISTWIDPIMIQFKGTIKEFLYNAFVFSFMYAPFTIIVTVSYLGIIYLLMFSQNLIPKGLIILFGPALIVFMTLALYGKAFKKYKTPVDK